MTFSYRPIKRIYICLFEQNVRSSSLFSSPERMENGFTDQLVDVLTSELDRTALLETVTRPSSGKLINRFLSEEAISAKQKCRRLKRYWKKTGKEWNRLTYCQCCRSANKLQRSHWQPIRGSEKAMGCSQRLSQLIDATTQLRWLCYIRAVDQGEATVIVALDISVSNMIVALNVSASNLSLSFARD